MAEWITRRLGLLFFIFLGLGVLLVALVLLGDLLVPG